MDAGDETGGDIGPPVPEKNAAGEEANPDRHAGTQETGEKCTRLFGSVKPHQGWFRVHEEALRIIERRFDRQAAERQAKTAYQALLRVANLEGSNSFIRKICELAKDMSYSYAAAEDALILIEATGLCEIERRTIPGTKEKEPSRYTVAVTLDDIVRSSKNYCRLSKSWKNEVLPRRPKNSPKNSSKNIKRERAANKPGRRSLALRKRSALCSQRREGLSLGFLKGRSSKSKASSRVGLPTNMTKE